MRPGWLKPPAAGGGTSLQIASVNCTLVSTASFSHEPQTWMLVIGPAFVQRKSSARMAGWVASTSRPLSRSGYWTHLFVDTGGQHKTVMVWLQVLVLPQQSVANQARATASGCGQTPLVTVLSTLTVTPVQHASEAVGGSKVQGTPQSTVLLLAQVRTGGVVSTTVTVW